MSGCKHNFPQLIQWPFAYRQQGKQLYVHAHHRTGGDSRLIPARWTKGFASTEVRSTSLEDSITRSEYAMAEPVQAIALGECSCPADMTTLICALAFPMRDALVGLFPALLEALRAKLLAPLCLRRDLMTSLSDPRNQKRLINDEEKEAF